MNYRQPHAAVLHQPYPVRDISAGGSLTRGILKAVRTAAEPAVMACASDAPSMVTDALADLTGAVRRIRDDLQR